MRKLILVVVLLFLSGCATSPPLLVGVLFTNVKMPITATSMSEPPSKVGYSSAISILGLVAAGDASIEKASKEVGITKIHHVDYRAFSVFGLFTKITVYVYGE